MQTTRLLCASLLLAATLAPVPAHAIGRVLPWQVTNLVADKPVCTGRGAYAYNASWTPATWENKPWLGHYIVEAHNCAAGPVQCSPSRCTVKVTACRQGAPGAWIAVKADVGGSGSGVRAPAIPSSRCLS